MKVLIFFLFLVSGVCYSQQATEKWNSLSKRYEYFDSRGYMTGYKVYNNLQNQWEYFDQTSKGLTYADPLPTYDFNLLYKALEYKQNQLDNNVNKVQNYINQLSEVLKNLDVTTETQTKINKRFTELINTLNNSNVDYSNGNSASTIINYLYTNTKSIIDGEILKSNRDYTIEENLNLFVGGYDVDIIQEKSYGEKRKISNVGNIYFKRSTIYFRKDSQPWASRDITFHSFDDIRKLYIFNSPQGEVQITSDLKTVVFMDSALSGYIYHISAKNYTVKPY